MEYKEQWIVRLLGPHNHDIMRQINGDYGMIFYTREAAVTFVATAIESPNVEGFDLRHYPASRN